MNERAERPIIVGADGSEHAYAAVEWAAVEAVRRGRRLRVVFVLAPWLLEPLPEPAADSVRRNRLEGGPEVLRQAAARAAARAPQVKGETELIPGCRRMIRQARPARLIRRALTGSRLRNRPRSAARWR